MFDRELITNALLASSVVLFLAQLAGFIWGVRLLYQMRSAKTAGTRLLGLLLTIAGAHLTSQLFAVVLRFALVVESPAEILFGSVILLIASEGLITAAILWGMWQIGRWAASPADSDLDHAALEGGKLLESVRVQIDHTIAPTGAPVDQGHPDAR